MKHTQIRTVFITLFVTVIAFNQAVIAQKTSLKVYGIKSGIIEYKHTGSRSGSSVMYFDDYGLKSAVKNDLKSFGKTETGWVISLKDEQYIFDPAKPKEGIKMKNPLLEGFFEMEQKDFGKFVKEFYEKMGFKKSGKENFLGKECEVFKGDLGKVLIWNGIMLLSESDFAGVKSRQEAISVKTNIPVDKKYFEIPKNITFKEAPSFDDIDKLIEDSEDEKE